MHAGDLRCHASERAATGPARFRIPRFKLTRCSTQPQQDAVFLRLLRLRREYRIVKQPGETCRRRQRPAGEPFQKQPPVQHMLIRPALAVRERGGDFRRLRIGHRFAADG